MHCFIYKSQKKHELYLYLDKRDDFSNVPDILLNNFGQLALVMELDLNPQRKLAREDVLKVIESIQTKGYFVQMPATYIPLSLAKSNWQLN